MGKIQSCWSMSQNSWPTTTFCVAIMMHRICLEQHLVEVAMTIHCSHWIHSVVINIVGVMSMTVFWSVKWECKIEAIKIKYGSKKWFWLGPTESEYSFRHKIQEFLWECYVLLKWIRFFPILGKKLANFPILLLRLQDLGACKICPRFGMHLQFHGYFSTSQVHLLFI